MSNLGISNAWNWNNDLFHTGSNIYFTHFMRSIISKMDVLFLVHNVIFECISLTLVKLETTLRLADAAKVENILSNRTLESVA